MNKTAHIRPIPHKEKNKKWFLITNQQTQRK
jgi:hypothetical protein